MLQFNQPASDVADALIRPLLHLPIALLLLLGFFALGRLAKRHTMRALSRPRANPQAVLLVGNAALLSGLVVGVVAGLSVMGVNLAAMTTGLGLLALGLGLGLADVIRSLVSGVVLLLEQPFRLGDFVSVGELSGYVEEVGLRTTSLRTEDYKLLIIPNSTVFAANLLRHTAYPLRRVVARAPAGRLLDSWESERARLLEAAGRLSDPQGPPVRVQLNVVGEPPTPIIEIDVWVGSGVGAPSPQQLRSDVLELVLTGAEVAPPV